MLITPPELVFLVGRVPDGKLFSERLENGGFPDSDVGEILGPLIMDPKVMEESGGGENDGRESGGIETDGRPNDEIDSGGIVVCVTVPVDGVGTVPNNEEDCNAMAAK